MKPIHLFLAALLAATGLLGAGPVLAFTNNCSPASACSVLPGDCGGVAVTHNYGGGTAQAGTCGDAGNSSYATGGQGGGSASTGVFSASVPVVANVVAYGAGAQAQANVSQAGEFTGSASLSNGGIIGVQINQEHYDITVNVHASAQTGSGDAEFDVTQGGGLSMHCAGILHEDIVYFGLDHSC